MNIEANSGTDNGFSFVSWKCQQPKAKLPTRKSPAAKQNVILQLESKSTINNTQCLSLANQVLQRSADLTRINFVPSTSNIVPS